MHPDPLLWLLVGGVASLFVSGRWNLALAAWLAPFVLLHYTQEVPPLAGLLGVWLVTAVATAVSHWRVVPVPGPVYPLVIAGMTLPIVLPYLVDRLLAPMLPGALALLVFPLAWTAGEYLGARVNPFGTWGVLAYTQAGNLPLTQLAAVTGLWGISFLVTAFASLANWVWARGLIGTEVAVALAAYTALLALVLVAGRVRLNGPQASQRSLRVATIGWPDGILEPARMLRVFAADFAAAERAELKTAFVRIHEHFLACTAQAARAGARLVVWPEANIMVFREDEPGLLGQLQDCAREHGIQLLAGIATLDPAAPRSFANRALWFDPSGAIVARYTKTTAVPGFESRFAVRGDGRLPVIDTADGRMTTAICYDLDFPWLLRQAGRAGAELLSVPASDWREIGELHHAAAVFRAVENGVSLLRATRWGVSAAVDPCGRELARLDHFAVGARIMVAQLPLAARATLYPRFGDAFAWLCVAGLAGLVSWGVARSLGG